MPTSKHCVFGVCSSDNRTKTFDGNVKFFQFPKPCSTFRKSAVSRYRSRKEPRNRQEEKVYLKDHLPNCELCRACDKWVRRCKRQDKRFSTIVDITKDTYICSLHFAEGVENVEVLRDLPGIQKKGRITLNSRKQPTVEISNSDVHPRPLDSSQHASYTECDTSPEGTLPTGQTPNDGTTVETTGETLHKYRRDQEGEEFPEFPQDGAQGSWESAVQATVIQRRVPTQFLTIPPDLSPGNGAISHGKIQDREEFHELPLNAAQGSRDSAVQATVFQRRASTQTGCVFLRKTVSVQCELTMSEIEKLKNEVTSLRTTCKSLMTRNYMLEKLIDKKREAPPFEVFEERLKEDDDMCTRETMFTYPQLLALVKFFTGDRNLTTWGGGARGENKKRLQPIQELIITLLRLKSGYLIEQLADLFELSEGLISQTVTTWIQVMYVKFKSLGPYLLASRDKIRETLPGRYHNMRNLRVIVDGAEFFCESPSDFRQHTNSYSQYKGHTTVKILLGCTPTGSICFVSEGFEGSISDRELVIKSGLLDMLGEGDMILADRGFTIKDLTDKKNIGLNIPSFLCGRDYLTPQEEIKTRIVAKNRIIIEHSVRRVKEFRIFQRVLPLTMRHVISQVVFVCACLSNFQKPIDLGD